MPPNIQQEDHTHSHRARQTQFLVLSREFCLVRGANPKKSRPSLGKEMTTWGPFGKENVFLKTSVKFLKKQKAVRLFQETVSKD